MTLEAATSSISLLDGVKLQTNTTCIYGPIIAKLSKLSSNYESQSFTHKNLVHVDKGTHTNSCKLSGNKIFPSLCD